MVMNVVNNKNMYLLRLATQQTELYYDSSNEVLYVVNDNTIYKYKNITYSVWYLISSGDEDFFESTVMNMPYTIVSRIPKNGATMQQYTLPTPTVVMYSVNSSNVAYAGYDAKQRRLYIEFLDGSVYEYFDVEPEIWNGLQKADSKGSFLHWFIKINDYRYDKVSGYGLNYTGEPMQPNVGESHENGYMTGF